MIDAENLSRSYGNQVAVADLTFQVRKGEVMGLLGPNGAGKSTTMKMLTGFLPPSSGHATVAGVSVLGDPVRLRRNIGYLPENAPSYGELSVDDHLAFIGRMHGLPPATLADRIAAMATVCGLEEVMRRRIDELSKGFKQRVGLAASMLHDPPCLILDEPTTGLDPNQIVDIRRLIRRLAEDKTVVLSSHVLSEVEVTCDRMLIIDRGRLLALGTAEELAEHARQGNEICVRLKGEAHAVLDTLKQRLPDAELDLKETSETTMLTLRHAWPADALAEAVFRAVIQHDAVILELRRRQASLEDVFQRLTGGGEA